MSDHAQGSSASPHRSGFACFVGRPNAGKSTLTNSLVGRKIAITSSKPQTTRHSIKAIVTAPAGQLVIVDTPGLHRPRTLLGQRLNDVVRTTWAEVDVIGLCLPADQRVGPGDRFIASEIAALRRKPTVIIVTKADLVSRERLAEALLEAQGLAADTGLEVLDIIPVSAVDTQVQEGNLDSLLDVLVAALPEGPQLYPPDMVTDEPEMVLVAELIREAALEDVTDELPHSLAVVVEEMNLREGRPEDKPLLDIFANVYVERSSQKPIIIGKKGARLREIGSKSRAQIEALLGTPVYLDLHVKIAKDWQRDSKQLRRLGF